MVIAVDSLICGANHHSAFGDHERPDSLSLASHDLICAQSCPSFELMWDNTDSLEAAALELLANYLKNYLVFDFCQDFLFFILSHWMSKSRVFLSSRLYPLNWRCVSRAVGRNQFY